LVTSQPAKIINYLSLILSTLKKYWLKFAALLAFINTRVILTLLYFFLLPFFALPYQLVLWIKNKKQTNSTWNPYDSELDFREQF
jgi:hypothetical protein